MSGLGAPSGLLAPLGADESAGTTLDAMNSGSITTVYIALIEGYPYALTNTSVAAASAALAGTDWAGTTAIGGMFVDLANDQSIHPFDPITSGGKCVLRIAQTAGDQFGIDTHKKSSTYESQLVESVTRATTTIKVAAITGAPASGNVHIGTECISYTGVTDVSGTTPALLTGCTQIGRAHV